MPGRGRTGGPSGGSGLKISGMGASSDSVVSKGSDGLNPNRQRGFDAKTRIETPTLNDMKAKQCAVVSKFMTFMNRKNTAMIELYERSFYNKRPGWDSLANFIYHDLCPTDILRQSVQDVQFHPVKMIIFIKFENEGAKNVVVNRLQSGAGVLLQNMGYM